MAIKKYIVNLPDYIEEDEKTGNLAFNGVDMHPVPYEESVGRYKETLEFLKVATKEELMSVYGYSSKLIYAIPVNKHIPSAPLLETI